MREDRLIEPVFVVGAGRSGSTAFFELLTYARNACWLTSLARPTELLSVRERMFFALCDTSGLGELLRRRYRPGEAYQFWNSLYPGFGTPCRDLVAEDVTHRISETVRTVTARMRLPTRERAIFKITGWPRLGFLNAIFPDAKFIHVVRDGRAVANSLLNVHWWRGWQGPQNWRWGNLEPKYQDMWERHGCSFVALAGIQWMILMETMRTARAAIPDDRFLEIRYEDLCDSPVETLRAACEFSGLRESQPCSRASTLRTQNDKWRTELTAAQRIALTDIVRMQLEAYGYDI